MVVGTVCKRKRFTCWCRTPTLSQKEREVMRRQPLDDAALRQVGDRLLGVADGREDLLVVRAQLGGSIAQRQALFTMRDRVAQNGEVAEHRGMHRLRHL